jgi:hypothetical protein
VWVTAIQHCRHDAEVPLACCTLLHEAGETRALRRALDRGPLPVSSSLESVFPRAIYNAFRNPSGAGSLPCC